MPTRAQLETAGHATLAADIAAAGGFASVATALGLRARRRPDGFWDNLGTLDEELSLFVAANWVELGAAGAGPTTRRGGRYYYNTATSRVRWDPPIEPTVVELDDAGTTLVVEGDDSRLMPSRTAVLAAGRYDLHHAVEYHGGYRAAREGWMPGFGGLEVCGCRVVGGWWAVGGGDPQGARTLTPSPSHPQHPSPGV